MRHEKKNVLFQFRSWYPADFSPTRCRRQAIDHSGRELVANSFLR